MYCSFLVRRIIASFNYEKMVNVAIFVTLGQPWLASIRSSWRGKPETTTGGLLLPQAAPLLVPRARRRLHRTTRWRCGWSATPLLLLYAWWLSTTSDTLGGSSSSGMPGGSSSSSDTCGGGFIRWLPETPQATMMNAPTSKRWAHLYELVLYGNCLVELLNVHTFISN
jgi:hypothetical protein